VKIQETLYKPLTLGAKDLTKKSSMPLIVQSETITDSYTLGTDRSQIEKEVLQVLKAIISDLKTTIDMFRGDNQSVVFPDISVKSSEGLVSSVLEYTIIMLFLPEKGEAPENPVKVFLSYKADKPSSEIPFSFQLVGRVVEEAKHLVKTLPGKSVFTLQDTKEEDTDNIGAEYGFIIQFSYYPRTSDGWIRQAEWVNTYHVSGKVIDNQYLNLLSLHTGEEDKVFEKLQTFISGIQPDQGQAEGSGPKGIPQKDQIAGQIGNIENAIELKKMQTELPLQSGFKENNFVVVSLDMQKIKDEAAFVRGEPVIKANGLISDDEGELRGTALNTWFSQGEVKSSPMAGFPLLPIDNNVIILKIVTFVEQLNGLLSGNGAVDEVIDETVSDGTTSSGVFLEKLHLLQTKSPQVRAVVQNVLKKFFGEFEEILSLESIGFSLGKNGSLRFDTSILVSQLTSNKEETINVMKGLGNMLYERINYLMHPCAGMYIDDKNILQLRAAQKDEGASLPDRGELSEEQSNLEKRLNELKLLIECSRLLTEWFTKNENIQADDPEGVNWST
jgi:hypothetical protein